MVVTPKMKMNLLTLKLFQISFFLLLKIKYIFKNVANQTVCDS